MQKTANLTSGLEDYLEEIYIAHLNNAPLKGAELARKLNISRASVSEALSRLVKKNLIKYNSYEAISLTPEGFNEAKKVYEKHYIIKNFFETVLAIPSKEAGENACKIEHIISPNILDKMTKFTEFCKKNPMISDQFKKENIQ
ncbi:MAG: metal-dependent transcriptional regulator [Muribaculaceae bacterium]|nr:metal-dependent transcriptional regulator [Muribaculaceae bacterium]